jgi:glycosyltransferase involved in cell wall biosynthesis
MYPPFGTPINILCLFLAVLREARRIDKVSPFDIIDAHFGYPDGVAAALLAGALKKEFVVTLRGSEPVFATSWMRRKRLVWALHRAACVISVSDRLREFATRLGVPPSRTRTIGNGVNANQFYPRDRIHCRVKHKLPQSAKVILSAGALLEAKGHHHVVRALSHLVRHRIDAHLVIAGSETRGGPGFERSLRQVVKEAEMDSRVHFTGWVAPDTLAEFMSAADVFCLASDSEGWPNVVHEAASCGTPVVVTDVGSIPQMIPSEALGIIVPVGDQRKLQDALHVALTREWDRRAIAAWAQSRSWAHVAGEVVDVMREALDVRN